MAQAVKTVLVSYTICALLGGFIEYVSPEKIKGIIRPVVAVLLVFSVAAPLAGEKISLDDFQFSKDCEENAQIDALMHTASLTEKMIKEELRNIIINSGVNEYEIYVETSIDREKNIVYLDRVQVEVGKEFSGKTKEIYNSITGDYKSVLKVGVKNE